MIEVSIISTVYNSEKFLPLCINSILNQTFKNFELILVNDGSTDNSYSICEYFAKKDSRIKIINKNNTGVSDSRNIGIKNSVGKFIMFIDSDDEIESNMLEDMVFYINKSSSDVCLSGFKKVNKTGEIINENVTLNSYNINTYMLDSKSFKELLDKNYISSVTFKIFKKSLISKYKFDNSMFFGEDLKFMFELLSENINIYVLNKCYYLYNYSPLSLTNSFKINKPLCFIKVYNLIFNFVKYRFEDEDLNKFLNNRIAMDYILSIEQLEFSNNYSLSYKYNYIKNLNKDIYI